jgi:hypothetical protein
MFGKEVKFEKTVRQIDSQRILDIKMSVGERTDAKSLQSLIAEIVAGQDKLLQSHTALDKEMLHQFSLLVSEVLACKRDIAALASELKRHEDGREQRFKLDRDLANAWLIHIGTRKANEPPRAKPSKRRKAA